MLDESHNLRVVAWEVTRRCPLRCRHCRGGAADRDYRGELTTDECRRVIDSLARLGPPMLILTGGEPMCRPDIYALAGRAVAAGLRVVMAPCGPLLTEAGAERLRRTGVECVSVSIDRAAAGDHDAFRGVPGAFASAMAGLRHAREAGLAFQINTTVTRSNAGELPAILGLAEQQGARTLDLFFLVPTGRGAALRELALSPAEAEEVLAWAREADDRSPLRVRTTCAPQAARWEGGAGCMAGRGFLFISHRGVLQPCGFLDVPAGDLRAADLDVGRACEASQVLAALRERRSYGGKCGQCEYLARCGGCRARAYAATGDLLAEDPGCAHVPAALRTAEGGVKA